MTSILFYLPVVTPWWFERIIAPMIRACAGKAKVSVMVPPLWSNTGIGPEHLAKCSDLEQVDWYVLDGDDHRSLREPDVDHPDLIELVEAIAPDLTFCRSADMLNPARFPGVVRYVMEGAVPPFDCDPAMAQIMPTLMDHGIMPDLNGDQKARLLDLFRPWLEQQERQWGPADRAAFLARTGLPHDKRIIGVALEYEHEEMFFERHRMFASNVALIAAVAAHLGEDCILACTNHPLNELHGDNRALHAAVAAQGGRVRLLPSSPRRGEMTMQLARYCDGFVVQDSKSFGGPVWFGTSLLRLSAFRNGAWMRSYDAFEPFFAAVRSGTAQAARAEDAALWFAFHFLDRVFDPADPTLDAERLIGLARTAVDETRWQPARDRLPDHGPAHADNA
ncbi:hypothetical protein [uncultured Sphingomonas sp.]|uniref:hypothetical protein n=1 Tax=uncultured Sphingomonas sp. TaxID=158754 RepID=UPI0025EDAA3C|nr:hypothetical protein [uncultured Sphingomonas sp.]